MKLFGIGSGLFLLCFLWVVTIIVLLLTTRAKPPYTSLGPVILLFSTLVTTLLLLIPRSSPLIEQEITSLEPIEIKPITPEDVTDWMHFWRSLIIIINLTAVVVGLILIYYRWVTKNMTRLRAPNVDFLKVRELIVIRGEDGRPRGEGGSGNDGEGTLQGKKKSKIKEKRKAKGETKRTRKKSENKEETTEGEQDEE